MMAVARGERRISVRSGHGVGKSALAAWLMVWFLLTRYDTKIVVTAPTSAQLFDALFAECKRWIEQLPPFLRELLNSTSDRVTLVAAPNENFISARTARAESPEALQGVHAANVLLIVDEASGVPEPVYEAAAGSMSGENATTLLLGNPTRTSGYFYDTHNANSDRWWTLRVNGEESKRVSKAFCEEIADTYGRDSNAYRVRVLGEFPKSDDDTIISLESVESSLGRDIRPSVNTPWVWGLDCARFGDDSTVLTKLQGYKLSEPPKKWIKKNTMEVAGLVKSEWDSLPAEKRPAEINIDVIGIGSGVVDRLLELGLPVRGINVSETPAFTQLQAKNLRTELYLKARDLFQQGLISLPVDEKGKALGDVKVLVADLVAVKYGQMESSGLTIAEPKKDTKKRIRRSPDFGDSFLLCLASDAASLMFGSRMGSNWNKPLKRKLPMV